VPEDGRVLRVRQLWFPTSDLAEPLRNDPVQILDIITSQLWSDATWPCSTASSTLSCLFKQEECDKAEVSTSRGASKSDVCQVWVCSRRTCVVSGIQFTRHFIKFVVVETKEIISSNSNVILKQQKRGKRLGTAVASKRCALAIYFSVHFCWMFLLSTCRGKLDLGLCRSSVSVIKCSCVVPTSDFSTCLAARFVGSRYYAAVFSLTVPNSCTDLDQTFLYVYICGTYSKLGLSAKPHFFENLSRLNPNLFSNFEFSRSNRDFQKIDLSRLNSIFVRRVQIVSKFVFWRFVHFRVQPGQPIFLTFG